MAHLVSISHLVNSCSGISTTDDGCSICLCQSLSYCKSTSCKCRVLEYTHWSVPNNCLSCLNSISEHLSCLRSDIASLTVCRHSSNITNLCLNRSVDWVREILNCNSINRKKDLLAHLLSLSHHFLTVIKLLIIAKRKTDLISLSLDEGVSHTTTDDQCITLLKEVVDYVKLVSYLSTTEDCYEWTYRILNSIS